MQHSNCKFETFLRLCNCSVASGGFLSPPPYSLSIQVFSFKSDWIFRINGFIWWQNNETSDNPHVMAVEVQLICVDSGSTPRASADLIGIRVLAQRSKRSRRRKKIMIRTRYEVTVIKRLTEQKESREESFAVCQNARRRIIKKKIVAAVVLFCNYNFSRKDFSCTGARASILSVRI